MQRRKTAILISGRGSNMEALIRAAGDARYPAEIVGIVSDRATAPGLLTAATAGIPTAFVDRSAHATKAAFEAAIEAEFARMGAEIVCLAGFMRILSAEFTARWTGRALNIHPSLLPSFKGLDTHARALEAGVRIHGCTVHFLSPEMDAGPIVAQAAVPVLGGDTPDSLAARVLAAEHRLYPQALAMVADGSARLDGDRVLFEEGGTAAALFPDSAPVQAHLP
jgi:formyltetrahydrofolate-dependent phosphoribosylglycinamide formyltransferase